MTLFDEIAAAARRIGEAASFEHSHISGEGFWPMCTRCRAERAVLAEITALVERAVEKEREAAAEMRERCSMLAAGHLYDVLAAKIRALPIEEDEDE